MSLFAGLIGNILAVVLAVWAFVFAGTKGRVVIATWLGLSFLLPYLWPGSIVSLVCFIGRIILAIGCWLYMKWRSGTPIT